MRAILITIADAANRDGDNARPGMRAIVEGSLYSEGSARRAIGKLVDDGWLEIVERGGGEGHDSVYRVLMGREVSQNERLKKGVSLSEVSQKSLTQMSNNATPVPLIGFTDTSCTEEAKPADPLKHSSHLLAVLAFEQPVKPVTRGGFPAVMARIKAELAAGTDAQRIEQAIKAGDITWTADGLRMAISRVRSSSERTINNPEVPYDPDREEWG